MFFIWIVLGKVVVDDVGLEPADSSGNAVSVAMAPWNVEHRVFVLEQIDGLKRTLQPIDLELHLDAQR